MTTIDEPGYLQVNQWQSGAGNEQINLPSKERDRQQDDAEAEELPGTIQQPTKEQDVPPDGDVMKLT